MTSSAGLFEDPTRGYGTVFLCAADPLPFVRAQRGVGVGERQVDLAVAQQLHLIAASARVEPGVSVSRQVRWPIFGPSNRSNVTPMYPVAAVRAEGGQVYQIRVQVAGNNVR
jgi:hypothetical protein